MSPAMEAYYAHRLANPWWKPEADEAAQWVADYAAEVGPYFVEGDGEDEPTIWREVDGLPMPVVRRCDLSARLRETAWVDLVASMTRQSGGAGGRRG